MRKMKRLLALVVAAALTLSTMNMAGFADNTMNDTFAEIIDGLESQTGLEGITIQVYYVKPNGETITGKLFK